MKNILAWLLLYIIAVICAMVITIAYTVIAMNTPWQQACIMAFNSWPIYLMPLGMILGMLGLKFIIASSYITITPPQ